MPPFALTCLVGQEAVPIGQKVKFMSFITLCLDFVSCAYFAQRGTEHEYYALR